MHYSIKRSPSGPPSDPLCKVVRKILRSDIGGHLETPRSLNTPKKNQSMI